MLFGIYKNQKHIEKCLSIGSMNDRVLMGQDRKRRDPDKTGGSGDYGVRLKVTFKSLGEVALNCVSSLLLGISPPISHPLH